VVKRGVLELAGTLWQPEGRAVATVLMHPGSGPSTRDNDVYFPPIRDHLLHAGIAVASFDKRGVGGSTGHWQRAGIIDQAHDAIAALHVLAEEHAQMPFGLFGHSQGGWVTLEAASRESLAQFVVTNSGPGVSPATQDRFSLGNQARRAGCASSEVERFLAAYDVVCELLRGGATFEATRRQVRSLRLDPAIDVMGSVADADAWALARTILDYDPRPAMQSIEVSVLALFGAYDEVVPVDASVDQFRAHVRPELLTVAVLPGGDHRIQSGEPRRLVDGYATTLVEFVLAQA
jgi:pimeloyl-ACP methyl ester carboxylesterase